LPRKDKREFIVKLEDAILEKLKTSDLTDIGTFLVDEGLYIALMSDLFLVSGRFRAFADDGVTHTFLARERLMIRDTIVNLRNISQVKIPLTDLRPLGWATELLSIWEVALGVAHREGPDNLVYFTALEPQMRAFMTLGLPGMLRIAVQLTRQLIQLIK